MKMESTEGSLKSDIQEAIKHSEGNAKIILEEKLNKTRRELQNLQRSYDSALQDLHNHFTKSITMLESMRERSQKALHTCLLDAQNKIQEQIQKMELLKKELVCAIASNKVSIRALDGGGVPTLTHHQDQVDRAVFLHKVLSEICEIKVRSAPPLRFVRNESFLSENGHHYFGHITALHHNVMPSELHLQGLMDLHGQRSTFIIKVPKSICEKCDIKSQIKCELLQTEHRAPISLTPVWVKDQLEVQFGFTKPAAFTLSVYLFDQHITGSPARFNPETGMIITAEDESASQVETVEAPPREHQSPNKKTEVQQCSESPLQTLQENKDTMKTSSKGPQSFRFQPCKIPKKTQIPLQQSASPQCKDNCEVPKTLKEIQGTMEKPKCEPGASCSSKPLPGRQVNQCEEMRSVWVECGSHYVAEQPVDTTTQHTQDFVNENTRICFPDRYIHHTFNPEICTNTVLEENLKTGLSRIITRLNKNVKMTFHAKSEVNSTVKNVKSESDGPRSSNPSMSNRCTLKETKVQSQQQEIGTEMSQCSAKVESIVFNEIEAKLVFITHIPHPYSLNRPVGIMQLSSGDIIVSDTFNDRLVRLTSTGGVIGFIKASQGLHRPSALVEFSNGNFAVISSTIITLFDAAGNYLKTLGKGFLHKSYGLALSDEEELVTVDVVSPGHATIVVICPKTGREVVRLELRLNLTSQQAEHSMPRFITLYKNTIYVGDLGLDCVYEIDFETGELLGKFGSSGHGQGYMNDPSGIACDADGNIFVGDSRNHRIQVFDPRKRLICILKMDYPLKRPSGICLTQDDSLLLLNYWDNSLAKYHLTFKYV